MKLTNEVPNELLQLCATRWMSRYEGVKRILDQWKVLQDFFHQAALEEKCYTARQLDSIYQDPKNYVYLIFLESILKDFSRLNKFDFDFFIFILLSRESGGGAMRRTNPDSLRSCLCFQVFA